jgi:hypothetical protein
MFKGALVGAPLPDLAVREWLIQNPRAGSSRPSARLVLFWNSADPLSEDALAFADSLARVHAGGELSVITIHTEAVPDESLDPRRLQEFLVRREVTLPVGVDQENAYLHQCGLPDIPALVIEDSKGIVRGVVSNYRRSEKPKIAAFVSDVLRRK